jgi:aminoglycoside 2'-N-acetyltransferase I
MYMTDTLILNVLPDHATPADVRAEIIALCSAVFDTDYAAFIDSFGRVTYVIAQIDDRIVSTAMWCDRWLQPEGLPMLRTAYVEGVATDPAYRGRGIASDVMRRIAQEIAGYELGALGPSDPAWYARLGWEQWRGPMFVRMDAGLDPTPDCEVMILRTPNTPPLDLDAAISCEWRPLEVW